ncbi:MAG: FMN-binding protein [Clostridiales bacterium]|nr:FMN-binding protein [Clostridiales bacterium]
MKPKGPAPLLPDTSGKERKHVFPVFCTRENKQGGWNHVKKQIPGWAVLLIITLVAGLALGATYSVTKDTIDQQAIVSAENARKAALPAADSFVELDLNIRSASKQGFAGPVYAELTLDESGKIATLKIGNDAFAETPGFGAKALEESFAAQFIGKAVPLTAADIDAIAGATVTTNAVVDAVNAAASAPAPQVDWCYAGYQGDTLVGYVAQITTQGFGGPIEVIAGLDTEMVITGISVGGSNFSETAGLGAKAKDAAFTDQFVGKPAPVKVIKAGGTPADNTVDAITAATITSNAVAGAVNQIADFVEAILFPEGRGDEIVLPEKPESGVVGASAKGFAGPVWVDAAFDAEGKIVYISVGNDEFNETPSIGGLAKDPEFLIQFIGKTAPLTMSDIDAISGATITSKAVVDALNAAYASSDGSAVPAETPAPAPTLPEKPAEGVFGASAQGFAGPVWVDVAFDADGKITYISVGDDQFAETPGFGLKAKDAEFLIQFIGKTAPLADADVDAIAGATITSKAVISAVNDAYDKSQGGTEEVAAPVATDVPATEAPVVTEAPAAEEAPAAPAYSASVQGFAGPVYVELTLDAEGKIASLKIGDASFAETPGFGAKALEEAFIAQFIGKAAPLTLADIDAIAGATVTSEAVINAINEACPAQEAEAAPAYSASVQGFAGPVYVELTLDAEGKIASLKIGDASFAETPGFGAKALEEAFIAQFIGKAAPLAIEDIDAIAGATVTTNAVLNAINEACGQAN